MGDSCNEKKKKKLKEKKEKKRAKYRKNKPKAGLESTADKPE